MTSNLRTIAMRALLLAAPISFGIVNLVSQHHYSYTSVGSRDNNGAEFLEIPFASSLNLAERLRDIDTHLSPSIKMIVNNSDNSVTSKLIAIFIRNPSLAFPATDYYSFLGAPEDSPSKLIQKMRDHKFTTYAKKLYNERRAHFRRRKFITPVKTEFGTDDGFTSETLQAEATSDQTMLLRMGGDQSVLNRFVGGQKPGIDVIPWSDVRNHVVFVDSDFGHTWIFNSEPTSFFGLGPDLFYPADTVAGLGRYLLLRIEKPTPNFRLTMFLTETLQADGQSQLPPAKIYGQNVASFHFVGRGMARALSDPIQPRIIDGNAYVFIDMGADGKRFKRLHVGGLFELYHGEIPLDPRLLLGFTRDISAVSDEQLAKLDAPSYVTPTTDFRVPGFFFSGYYEDGWLSEHSSFLLQTKNTGDYLRLNGVVPELVNETFTSDVKLIVDGVTVGQGDLTVGAFTVTSKNVIPPGKHHVEIVFDATQRLPGGDGRPVGTKFCSLGFVRAKTSEASSC